MTGSLGLIAGNGPLPVLVATAARARGLRVVATAMAGETDPKIDEIVEGVVWLPVGKLGGIIEVFRRSSVRDAVMAGGIDKKKFFSRVQPDVVALSIVNRFKMRGDNTMLSAVAEFFSENGIRIVESTAFLPELFAEEGPLTRRKPDSVESSDIAHGLEVVRALGRLDIGQCVVLKRGVVTAVEGLDGTDATIRRGGELANGDAVVVKVAKPNQDFRFDLPAVGVTTLRVMREVRARVLAIEAGRTIVFERDEFVKVANRAGIAVVGVR